MRRTETIVTATFVAATVVNVMSTVYVCISAHKAEVEQAQVKEDVRLLLNDIDNYGDIDTYTGSDHFEHLYKWSHNIK